MLVRSFCKEIRADVVFKSINALFSATRSLRHSRFDLLMSSVATLDRGAVTVTVFRMKPDELSDYMSALAVAKRYQETNEVWTNIIHHHIILHEYRITKAVLDIERILCPEICEQDTFLVQPDNWLEYLLRDIYLRLFNGLTLNLASSQYLSGLGVPIAQYTESDKAYKARCWKRNRPDKTELLKLVATYMGRILRTWLGLPSLFVAQGRRELVQSLVARFGDNILYLPMIWEVHLSLPRWLFHRAPRNFQASVQDKEDSYRQDSMALFIQELRSVALAPIIQLRYLGRYNEAFVRCAMLWNGNHIDGT